MDVNYRNVNRLVAYLATDSIDFEIAFVVILLWLQRTSPLTTRLLQKRLSLQRILNERRLGIENFHDIILPTYHNVQFQEHFRMARATFEVQIKLSLRVIYFT